MHRKLNARSQRGKRFKDFTLALLLKFFIFASSSQAEQ